MAGKGTTAPGFVNKNGQINLGPTNPPRCGTDYGSKVHVMHCPRCVSNYGVNSTDIHHRLCPYHWEWKKRWRRGKPGDPLQGDEREWRPRHGTT